MAIEWLMLPGQEVETIRKLLGRAWSGSGEVRVLAPTPRSRTVTVLIPGSAAARRAPRLPDVLTDWADIYEERLFPSSLLPVAGEVFSEMGPDCLALHADLGGGRGGVAWYEKGGLSELELVGQAAVSWRPGKPLSRPSLGGARAQLASLGRSMADTAAEAGLYDRVEAGLSATAEAVLARALIRLLGDDPPPLPELAAAVLRAPGYHVSV